MQETILNPTSGLYPATDDYVHGIELRGVERMVYVSGTMGLDEKGRAPETLTAQLCLIWENIRCILAHADMTTDNIIRVTSYLKEVHFADENCCARLKALGPRRVPTTAIVVGTLVDEWLVEVEVIAAA